MTIYNILDTSMPKAWSEQAMYELEWDIRPEFAPKLLECIFIATSEILSTGKLIDKPVALEYNKINGEMVAAAIIQFFPNEEDPTKPGNWSLVWTFDKNDIPENAHIIEGTHPNVIVIYKLLQDQSSILNMMLLM